jgi:hypothetical protein
MSRFNNNRKVEKDDRMGGGNGPQQQLKGRKEKEKTRERERREEVDEKERMKVLKERFNQLKTKEDEKGRNITRDDNGREGRRREKDEVEGKDDRNKDRLREKETSYHSMFHKGNEFKKSYLNRIYDHNDNDPIIKSLGNLSVKK